MKRSRWALGLLFAVLLGVIAFGTWTGFPTWDDAYLVLFLRESSVRALQAQHSHRPLFGLLVKWVAVAFGLDRGPYVAVATMSWALLAWQTCRLARRLLPGEPALAPLAALLTLTPILVTTQYTTVTTVLSVNLPVSLCLAALLICLRDDSPGDRARVFGAAALVAVAVAISEYGIAAGAASMALLATRRRLRAAGLMLLGVVFGYVVFRATGDLSVRAKELPSAQLPELLRHPQVAALRFVEGMWHCVVGAWATAAGAIRLDMKSRSTLLGALVGAVAGVTMAKTYPGKEPEDPSGGGIQARTGLLPAIAAGILPVVLANRSVVNFDPYESRYLLPVLPFAAAATALGLYRLTTPRLRRVASATLAAVASYWIVAGAFEAKTMQARMEELGMALRPLLRDPGIAVAVVPVKWKLDGSDLTPKVTWSWSDEDAKRVWVMSAAEAEAEFGPRGHCRNADRIALHPELMSTGRNGPVSHLVWSSPWGVSVGELESYCVSPFR